MSASPVASAATSARHDFDFLVGRWRIHHRRLNERLAHCDTWTTFEGSSHNRPLLGGLSNFDENVVGLPSGPYEAVSFRLFDAAADLWSIWWIDERFPALESPVKGRFEGGVGAFYSDDLFNGIPIRVRYLWLDALTANPRWEQAFSTDGGATWETNWTMVFERVEA